MIDLIAQSVFGEVAALLVLAAVIGFVGIILRQPLIVSFIAVGLIAGPSASGVVRSDAEISLLSELGIAVTSRSNPDTEDLMTSGADIVLEPFQDAADRAVELLTGGERFERTVIPDVETEDRSMS